MKAPSDIKRKRSALAGQYRRALLKYLGPGCAASLEPALKLGRRAAAQGLETLDLALIHERALAARPSPDRSSAARGSVTRRAEKFFAEAVRPIEAAHPPALAAQADLGRLERELARRTLALAESRRRLKEEAARHRAVKETLRQSEQHSRRLLKQARVMQEQLRLLSRQVLSAQEEERKRISRELHDVIAQMLTGINVRLATLKTEAEANAGGLSKSISHTQQLVEKSVDVVHRFARELRPTMLDDLGLIPALHSFMQGFTKDAGIRTSLTAFAQLEKLSGAKRTVLYRVVQEALANVARHARAGRVEVSIRKLSDAVRLEIKDDGRSFEVERMRRSRKSQRLGLLGMRERVEMVGGSFSVEASPGKGTTIKARIPFRNGSRGAVRL